MLPLISWIRPTFLTMLSATRERWLSFTCWIRARFRSSTACTSRNLRLNWSHTSASSASSSSSTESEPETLRLVGVSWWLKSMLDSAPEEESRVVMSMENVRYWSGRTRKQISSNQKYITRDRKINFILFVCLKHKMINE